MTRKHNHAAGDPIRVALLGAGKIANTHARILKSLPGVRLAAVSDIDPTKAEALARRWDIPAAFGDSSKMLRAERVDAVHVLTPPQDHARSAIECMEAGCHVLIEKPMATTAAECEEIRRAARRHKRTVGVNQTASFLPLVQRLVDLIRSRRLGAAEEVIASFNAPLPLSATGLWMLREPGNIILEIGPHPLSQILRLMGPVRSASVTVANKVMLASGKPFYRTWLASLLCERGPVQLHISFGRDYGDAWITVVGQDGVATIDLKRDTLRISENSRFMPAIDNLVDACANIRRIAVDTARSFGNFSLNVLGIRPLSDGFNLLMKASIGDFYCAIRDGRNPKAGLEQGAAVVQACEAIIRSSGVLACESEGEREEKVYV